MPRRRCTQIRAGCRAYAAELRAAFKEDFAALSGAGDEEIARLKKRVKDKVTSAIKGSFSFGGKLNQNFFHDQDDFVNTAFARFSGDPLLSAPIHLDLDNVGTR